MGTTLSTLAPPEGAKHRKKRIGRGPGSTWGTTAGRGQKGQGSRSGRDLGRGFEGGQMPLQRRLPKRGFINPFRVDYIAVNVSTLAKAFEAGAVVDPEMMRASGLAPRKSLRLKILGNGEIPHALTVKAHAFSKSAIDKIKAAGGDVEVVPVQKRIKAGSDPQESGE